jgi:hypothetical protein
MAWQYPHGHAYDLFVSYSTRDLGWVRVFHDDLVADINRFADLDAFPFLDKARLQRRTDRGVRSGCSRCRREVRAAGFVTSRENPVDITHQCIPRKWPRLGEWLGREARNARRLRELAQAAEDAGGR